VKDKGPLVLCELLLDSGAVQQIKTYRTLFLRVSDMRFQVVLGGRGCGFVDL